jgi:flagellin-like protein
LVRTNNVRKITKFKRSIKAISPVIATLLMIAIAVVASLVVYAWVSGYMGFQTNKAGKAIDIPSFALSAGGMTVYVQNVGQGTVQIGAVYVNDELKADFTTDSTKQIAEGNTIELPIPGTYDADTRYNIKVTTTDGTPITTTGKPGSGGTTTYINLTPSSGSVGIQVTVTGSNFNPSTTITATFDGANLNIGSHSTDATGAFSGITFNVPSATVGSKTVVFTAGKTASQSFLVTSPSMLTPNVPAPTLSQTSITLGNSITASVTVTGTGATPTGTATFQSSPDGTTWSDIGTPVTLTAGAATSTAFTPSSAGTYSIRVVYSGDSVYNGATGLSSTLTVNNKLTPTVPAPTLNPATITLGASMTASVTVSGTGGTPTGTVTFEYSTNGGTTWNTLGTANRPLSGGGAVTSTSFTPNAAGSYLIHAVYSGDGTYNTATGTSATLTVNKANPTVPAPSVSPSPVTVNNQVTLSVTISGVTGVTPTGTATFQYRIGGSGAFTTIGSAVALSAGSASTTYTPTSTGTYQFQVVYSGDSNYNGATSSTTSLTVNAASYVFTENFATSLSAWTILGTVTRINTAPAHDGYYADFAPGSSGAQDGAITKAISSAGYTSGTVTFYARVSSTSNTHNLDIQWSTNGINWNTITTNEKTTTWTQYSATLPAGALNNANLQIRFVSDISGGSNIHAYVDDIVVTLTP